VIEVGVHERLLVFALHFKVFGTALKLMSGLTLCDPSKSGISLFK
jgi:hypothetical protein